MKNRITLNELRNVNQQMCKLIASPSVDKGFKTFDIAIEGDNNSYTIYRVDMLDEEGYSFIKVGETTEEIENVIEMELFSANKIVESFVDLVRESNKLSTALLLSNISNNQIKFVLEEELNLDKTNGIVLKKGKNISDIFNKQVSNFTIGIYEKYQIKAE